MQTKENIQNRQLVKTIQMTNSQQQHRDITPLLKPRLPSALGILIIQRSLNVIIPILP